MVKPLDGLLVLTLEQAVAAPYCSCRLADAGARVIKIERTSGDFARHYDQVAHGESAYFAWLNRGKESLVADIKDADDRALLHRILAQADIFIQNLAPGAAARAGFDPEALRRRHPGLITCSISGYGETGDHVDRPAYDLLLQAETGLCAVTGTQAEAGRVGVSVCDIAAGMYAHQSILEAIIQRQQTGAGRHVSVSLFDGMADWMTVPLLHYDYGGKAPSRMGIRHPSIAPYGVFRCRDGGEIVISIQNEREWGRFCQAIMERPDWAQSGPYANNVGRVANRDVLDRDIQAVFEQWDMAAMIERLNGARIAFGRLNGVDGLSRHPVLRRVTVDSPTGPVAMPAPPPLVDGATPDLGPVPALGQHGKALREEFAP